jgi:hypothetical protein
MKGGNRTSAVGRRRSCFIVALLLVACTPSRAHHQRPHEGATIGVAIPAIGHGEVLVVAKYRAQILDLAARQPRTDPTLRRLSDFVSLQHFACFWGLVPGSLSDETSPFNECSHAYLAGARALLAHMVAMPGDQSSARALAARIDTEIAGDPAFSVLCSNTSQAFDSGIIIGPDWQLAPANLPTTLIFSALMIVAVAGFWGRFSVRSCDNP